MQAAPRVDVAQQRRRVPAVRPALHGAHRFGDGEVHHPLAHVVTRQSERIVHLPREARGCGLLGGRRLQLLEDVVEQALVERELAAKVFGRDVGRDFGDDPDRHRLVLEIDRERELLRHVVGIELERAFRRAQRAVVVAEIRKRETQVVMRAGVLGIRLDGAHERVARIGKTLELYQHQSNAVPGRRGGRLAGEHLAVRFERELKAAEMGQEQREVEPGADKLG